MSTWVGWINNQPVITKVNGTHIDWLRIHTPNLIEQHLATCMIKNIFWQSAATNLSDVINVNSMQEECS